ncbi:HlyC/CorC family transporter [Patescibacteria group bacterium]|nr:HlyC/CorC family transporter [Patescibacteria group bacterium]
MEYLIVIFLVLLSGLFSGLTLGLLSLDKNELKRKISLGDVRAKKVYSVRKNGNFLLATLLLGNVAVNSSLAIFLGNIASGVMAGIIATGLIVIFGEILPQATFSRYALAVGAQTAWLVKIFMIVLSPICWPIAWILDKGLGEEMPTVYSKKELMKIIEEHEDSTHSDVDEDEERIIKGALSYSNRTVEQVMTPRTVVFALDINTPLGEKTLNLIKEESFTRVPVYEGTIDNVKGVLYVKDLLSLKDGLLVKDVYKEENMIVVSGGTHLDKLLNIFINSKAHIAFVKDEYGGFDGVITLEDILEEILLQEIVDETDDVPDLQEKARETK